MFDESYYILGGLMKILNEFISSNTDPVIKTSSGLIINFYNEHQKMIPKGELDDFQQDIILCVLKSRQKYDPSIGAFPKMLCWDLRSVLHDVISKYTGIKMSRRQYPKFKKDEGTLMLCAFDDKEV